MTTTPEARPEWEPVGYFSELKSAMTYRLWEQGGHEQQGDEVPLYSPAVHTEMLRAQASERVLRQIVSECAAALGTSTGVSPACSIEFMRMLPGEIAATVAALEEAP